jgi:hypothetical protein
MSDPTPGFDPGVNPKAAAKAAKAYAKASRPWYRKKRWWALAAVVVIVIIAVATSNGSDGPKKVDNASSASTGGSTKSGDNTAGTEKNPIKIGETVELAGTRYTVKKVDTTSQIGGDFGTKADGKFVVVTLTIENMKNETKTFSESAAKLVAADDTQYSTDDDGSIFADNSLILEDMQPELPKTGVLVFDVPPSKLAGAKLKVSDLFGKGDAYVDLGLK